jgi:hypothetical protein
VVLVRREAFPREARLLAIGGPAHGKYGQWGKYADPDGYVLVPVMRPVVFERIEPGQPPTLGESPPRYRVVRVLLPGWRVPFWAAVHMPWPRREWHTDERLGLVDGDVLPGSRVGIVEPLHAIAVGVYSSSIVWPVTQWYPGNWLPGPFRPRDVPLDSELAGLLAAGITLDEWRAGVRP